MFLFLISFSVMGAEGTVLGRKIPRGFEYMITFPPVFFLLENPVDLTTSPLAIQLQVNVLTAPLGR